MPGIGGVRLEGNSMPFVFDIERDPREEDNMIATMGWSFPHYMKLVGDYIEIAGETSEPGPG